MPCRTAFGVVCLSLLASRLPAQRPPTNWEFHVRLLATGTNRASEPAGFKAYSAFPLEVGLRRAIDRRVRLELSVRSESREIDQAASPTAVRLGSLEVLPLNLVAQYRFRIGSAVQPYLGAGVNATMAWEKSGVLDSMNVSPSLGPTLQAGLDIPLDRNFTFNADFRWNTWKTTIESDGGSRLARLMVDPSSLGVGIAVHF
jgi:outer membrane protein W